MKIIVHAPTYMAARAADLAAKAMASGDLKDNSIIGILSGEHAFTIKRNKASVSVWHNIANRAAIDPDKWEAA